MNTKLPLKEYNKRLEIYNRCSTYKEMGKEMFLSTKGVESWIRTHGLKQPEGIKRKLKISSRISMWEYKSGLVGRRVKDKTFVKKRPECERIRVRNFIGCLIHISNKSKKHFGHKEIGMLMKEWVNIEDGR